MNLLCHTSPLWQGGLTLGSGPALPPPPADAPPVVAADAATVVAGGSVRIAVLANDTDPEGGALTLLRASAERGTVAVEAGGTLLFAAPDGYSGTVTIAYTVADPAGNEAQGTVAVEVVSLAVLGGEAEGEFVVNSAPGTLTVRVVEPAEDAGDYVLKTADLASGPVNLAPPRVAGTAEAGAILSVNPGLWAFDDADAPLALARQWVRGADPIAGAAGASYTVAAADAGQSLRVVETGSTSRGGRAATSAGVPVPAAPRGWTPAGLPGLAIWTDASDAATITIEGGSVTQLADKSGNGRHLRKVTGAPAPTLEATLAGKPAMRFPAGGLLRSGGAPLPGLPGMPGVSVIAVTQAHPAEAFRKCVSIQTAQPSAGQYVSVQTGYSMMWFGNGNRYWTHPPSGPVVAIARYLANGTHASAEWWRNGVRLAPTSTGKESNTTTLPATAFLQLGYENGASSEQAECLLIVGPLSDDDRQKAEGYLAHKWGLAGQLPAAHPFRAAPPA
jgi:hypothetical protein